MLCLAVALGIFLRLHQLSEQIPADDEWHALHAASRHGFLAIGADFGGADRCIPLSLFYKAAAETVGLGERLLRLPPLLAGIGLLLLPWILRPALPRRTLIGAGWLFAVSPLLIYFSRYARPYSISLLLALLAAVCFYRWWKGGGRPWIVLYVLSTAASTYFHLSVIFFVVAPFGFAFLEALLGGERKRLGALLGWGGVTAGMLALLCAPPLLLHRGALLTKAVGDRIDYGAVETALQLMAGSRHLWAVLLLAALSAVGGWALARSFPSGARYALFLCLAQIAGVLATGPIYLAIPIVLTRYSLVILPLLLLAAAQGASAAEERLSRGWLRLPEGSLCAAVAALMLWAGPLRNVDFHPNNWTNHALFNYTYDLLDPRLSYFFLTQPQHLSPFYQQLAARPPESLLLLEAPWHYEWHYNHYPHLQYRHRQRMMVGFVNQPGQPLRDGELRPRDSRFDFSSFAHLSEYQKIRRAGVDYVILHKDLSSEFAASAPQVDMSGWIARYRADFGPAAYEDDLVAVFGISKAAAGRKESGRRRLETGIRGEVSGSGLQVPGLRFQNSEFWIWIGTRSPEPGTRIQLAVRSCQLSVQKQREPPRPWTLDETL